MNKEQAIAALTQERERVDALYRQRDEGSGYQHELSGQLTGIRSCLQILRALPDEPRWTRERLMTLTGVALYEAESYEDIKKRIIDAILAADDGSRAETRNI